MGIFFRLFSRSSNTLEANNQHNSKEDNQKDNKSNKSGKKENNIINAELKINKKLLCLKIYIVGSGNRKDYIIDNLFKDKITDPSLQTIADKEFKTDQFHWIVKIYGDEKITEEICQDLINQIENDKSSEEKKDKILKYQVILCFGNENTKILSENFEELRRSRMIFITDEKCELSEEMDKRYATNIICKDISNEDLNSKIISSLWELDCCFNEKGNQICRYTPEKIFKGLEKDNSLFSINILLTGLSRTGKSTFINLLSGKIMSLEADETESVTKTISEYYIYKDDDKEEHGAIKIIDTPGIVPNRSDEEDYKNAENKVINMIKNQDKSFENKIHFIFFVLMKGAINLEGKNIKELLLSLNESKCPVYILINKVKKDDKKPSRHYNSIIEYLGRIGCKKLKNKENILTVNFKNDEDSGNIHGINKIFEKIYNHIIEKNYLNKELKEKMSSLLKEFRAQVESNKNFGSYLSEDKSIIGNLKLKIKFENKMKEIHKLTKENDLFSKIEIISLMNNGKIISEKCKDVIISLSNLKEILPTISKNLPVLSIFQAFMVKEIGEGYGLDINILNSGTKSLVNNMYTILTSKDNLDLNKNDEDECLTILDKKEINKSINAIKNKLYDKLEKGNKNSILNLATILNSIKEMNIKNIKNKDKLENFNKNFTNDIYRYCVDFFENELIETEGLSFMNNYFNKCESLLEDIQYYIKKNNWEDYDIEIKN